MDFKFFEGDRVRVINPSIMSDWTKDESLTPESHGVILERFEHDDRPCYLVHWDCEPNVCWCAYENEIIYDESEFTGKYDTTALFAALCNCSKGEVAIRVDSEEEKSALVRFAESIYLLERDRYFVEKDDFKYAVRDEHSKITFSAFLPCISVVPPSSFERPSEGDRHDS